MEYGIERSGFNSMETSGQEISSNELEIPDFPKLSTKEQEEVLQACSTDIEGMLDLEQIRCHLYQHKLLSDSDCATLQAPDFELSRKTKIQMLITNLPRKGSDALDRFVKCLINSADGTGHRELAQIICRIVKERNVSDGGNSVLVNKVVNREIGYTNYLKYVTAILLTITICFILCMVYVYWPTIMYRLNLDVHSKSLPYLSHNFVGREKEMKEVSRLLDYGNKLSDTRIINIHGSPGFGKSTLAVHIGHKMAEDGVTVHYVNMDDFPDKDIKTALAEKIIETTHIVSKNITFERLLRWARECYSSTLVILDNCDDLLHQKKEEFHQTVEKVVEESLNIKIILTSRKVAASLMYFQHYKIQELSIAASCQLLEHKVPFRVKLSSEEKEEIAKLTGNVPLALQIIGSVLDLPYPPSPTVLIDELKNELIKTLSPEDFPARKQVFTTINISYKYLPKELQQIGRQLTVFPGSFDLPAAFAVCYRSNLEPTKEFGIHLKTLVRNSLLEHSQRTDRYQYHRLINEYFLLVQRRHWPSEAAKCLPAFNIYYATQLKLKSELFKYQHDFQQPVAFLDTEQHNLEHLFENLKQMQSISANKVHIEEFLATSSALSVAFDASFLQVRFSMEKCCMLLNPALSKLDEMMQHLRYHLLGLQSYTEEHVLHFYLTIIKLVAKCARENHGVWVAVQVYSVRKPIIESKSAVITSDVTYINFFMELRSLYLRFGDRYEEEILECYRVIISRTHAHLANCPPMQCRYYDIAMMYHAMGQYLEASKLYKKDLKRSKGIMHQIRGLVRLVYLYSYIDEYDEMMSTIARLQSLYSDVAPVPLDQLVEASDAVLMFIQFYRAGGLFDEVYYLENRFFSGLLNLEKEVRTAFLTKHRTKHQKFILHKACRALAHIFETGNYSKTVEVGTFLIKLIENSDSFNDTKIRVHLLVGQAKFHMGKYTDGMDLIEFALLSIPNITHGYGNERSITCWYLILRLKYLNTCYSIKEIIILSSFLVVRGTLWLILSPAPFHMHMNIPNRREKPILPLHRLSHSTSLATTSTNLDIIVDRCSKWLRSQVQMLHFKALSGVKAIFQLKGLSFIKLAIKVLYLTICVLIVWLKLILVCYGCIKIRWLRQPIKSRLADYYAQQYCTHFAFYAFGLDKLLSSLPSCRSFTHVKEAIRKIRDPRFRYGEDETPHSKFLDAFDDALFSELSVYR